MGVVGGETSKMMHHDDTSREIPPGRWPVGIVKALRKTALPLCCSILGVNPTYVRGVSVAYLEHIFVASCREDRVFMLSITLCVSCLLQRKLGPWQ